MYLVGDWCTGRLFGLGWDGRQWQLQELLHTNLQFTAGGNGEDGYVYAVNCNCFYTSDRGPTGNPPGALWKIVPASEVRPGQETALTVQQMTQASPSTGAPVFRNALNNSPITLNLYPNETVTPRCSSSTRRGTIRFAVMPPRRAPAARCTTNGVRRAISLTRPGVSART